MSVLTWLPGLASSGNRDIFAESPSSGDFGGGRLDGRRPPICEREPSQEGPDEIGGDSGSDVRAGPTSRKWRPPKIATHPLTPWGRPEWAISKGKRLGA